MTARRVKLGDLGEWGSGGTPLASRAEYYGGEIPWLIIEDLNDGFVDKAARKITRRGLENSSAKVVPPGTLLIAMYGSIGKLGITRIECATNQAIAFCKCDPRIVDTRFLFYLLLHERDLFLRAGRGGTQQNISQEFLKEYEVPLRCLPEQRRMAALLDEADRLVCTRRYALELTDTLLPATFLKLFGDENLCATTWPEVPLGEHLEAIEGGVNFNPVGENDPASDWRVLKVSAVSWSDFAAEESKPISPDESFSDKLIVQQGDLIMSRANTVELVGAVARVRMPPPKVLLPDKLWRLKLAPTSRLLPEYLLYALRSAVVRREIETRASGTSGSMKNISKEDVRELRLPVPPLTLQEKFTALVERVERLRATQREALRQAEHLFASLLHHAFNASREPPSKNHVLASAPGCV